MRQCDKEPRRADTARQDAKGEGPELGATPLLPCLAKPPPHQEPGPLLCASGLPLSSQSLVTYFLNSFTPQHTSVAPALRRSHRNLPDLQHPCLSTSLHTRVSCRAQNGECRTQALSNEQLEASMMRDQECSRMEQELRATTSRQRQRGKAVAAAWTRVGFWGSVINESVKSELLSSEPRDGVQRCPTAPWGPSLPPKLGCSNTKSCQLLQPQDSTVEMNPL